MSVNAAIIAVVPSTSVDYQNTVISEIWDIEAFPTLQLAAGTSTDGLDYSLTDIPIGGLWLKAHSDQVALLPAVTDVEVLSKRTMPLVYLPMATPVIVRGRPMQPKYWISSDGDYTLREDDGHLQVDDDPNPIWNPTTSTFNKEPPDGGVGDMRWTVYSLPDPADYATQFPYGYPLGTRTSLDGSTGLPSSVQTWAGDAATPGAAPWVSQYPFKPNVVSYDHLNADGSIYTVPRGVQFNMHYTEHMWMNMRGAAATHNMPFTWIIIATILDFPGGNYRHTILDSGNSPFNASSNWSQDNASIDQNINGENLGYRTYLAADRNYEYLASRTNHTIHTRHPATPKPKMYWGIFNGNNSYVGNWTTVHNSFKGKITNDTFAHEVYLLGRCQGKMGVSAGAHMVVFEMRFWSYALTGPQLQAQYAQLATTWNFSKYQ